MLLNMLACSLGMVAHGSAWAGGELPYRSDTTNERLPWYQLKAGEFPPHGSEHRVDGELVEADFIHRTGQFRTRGSGELVDFTLLPFARVMSLNAEADLRDLPLGTSCRFSLYQDDRGRFTKVAALEDQYTLLAGQDHFYRLEEVKPNSEKLEVSLRGSTEGGAELGRRQFFADEKTRIWKGVAKGKLSDLAVGDELLVNGNGDGFQGTEHCADIWVGAESWTVASGEQRRRHEAFLRERGLAGWIDGVEGKKVAVTLFGSPSDLEALCKRDGVVPSVWAKENRFVDAVVANDELRTYNPPVDRRRAKVLKYESVPTDLHGCGGVRWVIEPDLLLEGFRKGMIIRLFVHPSWSVNDMPFGEGLYSEDPNVRPALEEPVQYPYRTDFANETLPWYRLKPGEFPPFQSHHLVAGELVKVDLSGRSGQFRADHTGELVNFTLPPFGTVLYVNTEAELTDLLLGTRYLFYLHQDEQGAFIEATVIKDEFTNMAAEDLSYRLDAVELAGGRIYLSKRHARIKNDKETFIQPPDLGWGEFAVDASTRVWKGDKRIELGKLVLGDELLVNRSGRTATRRGICTDIWVGTASHKLATETQRSKHNAFLRGIGLPGWIENADGKNLTIAFFSGSRKEFPALLNKDVEGDGVFLSLADEQLQPVGRAMVKFRIKNEHAAGINGGTYGFSGVRWNIEAERDQEHFRPGQVVRVHRQGWPLQDKAAEGR